MLRIAIATVACAIAGSQLSPDPAWAGFCGVICGAVGAFIAANG